MILSKLFTGWGIGSTKTAKKSQFPQSFSQVDRPHPTPRPFDRRRALARQAISPEFRTLSWQLLLSYLGAMVAVVGISTVAVYQFFAYNLYQRTDRQLVNLAKAAARSLPVIKADRTAIERRSPLTFDNDGDLDLPWQDLRENDQSVEWFDTTLQPLGRAGSHFPKVSPVTCFQIKQQNQIRALTIPVFPSHSKGIVQPLLGYVRVSGSTTEIEEELNRLLAGLGLGGLISVILIGGTGWWLTRRSLQPIEQNFRQLRQFTADASHELRSPLTAIRTAAEVMQSHPERVHPSDVRKLEAIASAARQMTHLVEDLLLLARNDAVSTDLATQAILVPVDEILEDLIASLESQAEVKGITLIASGLATPVLVKGDAVQLRRMFSNLLDNALQYTPAEGRVNVILQSLDSFAVIKVEDTGIGIAPEQLPWVFDRFWRADQARSHRVGGSGLGLAIAQAIAHAHSGEITVSSQVGAGSCFQVKLPIS